MSRAVIAAPFQLPIGVVAWTAGAVLTGLTAARLAGLGADHRLPGVDHLLRCYLWTVLLVTTSVAVLGFAGVLSLPALLLVATVGFVATRSLQPGRAPRTPWSPGRCSGC